MKHYLRSKWNVVSDEAGRVGYLVLWLLGAPIGLLLLLWVIFGNNLLTRG